MASSPRRIAVSCLASGALLLLAVVPGTHARVRASVPEAPPCPATNEVTPNGLVAVIEHQAQRGEAAELRVVKNPSVRGVALQIHWSDLEPAEGQPDWSALDALFAAAESAGKWVHLIVFPGFFSPAWALEGVRTESFPIQYGPGATTVARLPMPWDRTYLSRWTAFLKLLGDRYGASPSFRLVAASGPTSVSEETTLPRTPEDLPKWQAAGYTPSKYVASWKDVLNVYASNFPNQCVSISGAGAAGVDMNDQGKSDPQARGRASRAIVDHAMQVLGRRLALQSCDVHAGSTRGGGPNSTAEDRYIINQIGHVITGFLLRTSVEHGSAVMGAEGNPPLALRRSLDLALVRNGAGRTVDYIEVYAPDVLAENLQPVLESAAARLKGKR